jgi:hypothetical protein
MQKIPANKFPTELSKLISKDRQAYFKAGWVSLLASIPLLIFLWPLGVLLFLGAIFCFYFAFKLKSGKFESERLVVLDKEHWIKYEPLEDSDTPIQYDHYIIKTEDLLKLKQDVYVSRLAFEIISLEDQLEIFKSKAGDLIAFAVNDQPYLLQEERTLSDGSKKTISTSIHQTKRSLVGWERV